MMDRRDAYGAGAVQVARGPEHRDFELYGVSEGAEAYRAAGSSRFRGFVQAAGAILSLVVIGFGGYWGYRQIMRDMHGVPVVRALEGPVRVAPDDPGGQVADHAGLAVNAVQAVGVASAPEERLTLAPAPVSLTDEDLPVGELLAEEGGEITDLTGSAEDDDAELVINEPTPQAARLNADATDDDPIARAIALANASTQGATPLSGAQEDAPATEVAARVSVPDVRGLPISPRPRPRPAHRAPAPGAPTDATPATGAAPAVLEASAVPAGTRLVQLGAFDSADDARAAWRRIATRFDGLMEDKTQIIVAAEAGGRTFWRLRAMGFADLSEARRFCAALVAERADCIPVVAK